MRITRFSLTLPNQLIWKYQNGYNLINKINQSVEWEFLKYLIYQDYRRNAYLFFFFNYFSRKMLIKIHKNQEAIRERRQPYVFGIDIDFISRSRILVSSDVPYSFVYWYEVWRVAYMSFQYITNYSVLVTFDLWPSAFVNIKPFYTLELSMKVVS